MLMLVLTLASLGACIDLELPPPRTGHIEGRVLIAPGVPLAHAAVSIDQLDIHDREARPRRHVGTSRTDGNGYFDEIATGAVSELILIRTQGGEYRDLVSGEQIQLDASTELRALQRLRMFTDASYTITPVHSLVEARFRSRLREVGEPLTALEDSYRILGAHLGALSWEQVVPADVSTPATSPTDEVRAAFLLGGLSVLADDLRGASESTPQAVHLFTLLDAMAKDLSSDAVFDGNDGNSAAPGSGLQIGSCPPVDPSCTAPPVSCQLGACRPACDLYVNLVRGSLVGAVRKFVGSRAHPSPWNHTMLGSEDARPMLEVLGGNTDAELFGAACLETADRVAPTLSWETLEDGAFVAGTFAVRVRATDDAEALPRAYFATEPDTDGDSGNDVAVAVIDTRTVNAGADGPFTITAMARDLAGNERRVSRTFQADNTAPVVTLAPAGFYVDGVSGVWWTGEGEPILSGSLDELHPRTVEIVIAGAVVANATIEGSGSGATWRVRLPPGKITSGGNEVVVRAIDLAGNVMTTAAVQLRLDATPPGVLVEESPVFDEGNSTVLYDLDNPATNTWLQRYVAGGSPIDLAQSMNGSCATVRKFSHLLYEGFVLGAAGSLNPLKLNAVVSDDGVGIAPGTSQARVTVRSGAATTELLPWTPLTGTAIAPRATRYLVGLYRDGALAIPALGTTEGEYHVELRAMDRLGRVARQERCWTHRILAPRLRPTPGLESGALATGSRSMFSTSLNPGAPGQGPHGDFAAKFLNSNAAGAAVWAWRVKNYLGAPVYVTVRIPSTVNASVHRQFVVRNGLTAHRAALSVCGVTPCTIATPTNLYPVPADPPAPPELAQLHQNLKFRARLFLMNGADTGAELLPCPGCTNDAATQTYTFELPARTTPQGAPLAEYVVLTYLRPTLPAGAGTNVLMAPSNLASPDLDPGGYGELVLNGQTLTGKLLGGPGIEVCTAQEFDGETNQWTCTEKANRQRYRALVSITYEWLAPVETTYEFSAASHLPRLDLITGTLFNRPENRWFTSEALVLP